jgi:streptogramin lyase
MRISNFGSHRLGACAAIAMLAGCAGIGSQVTPAVSMTQIASSSNIAGVPIAVKAAKSRAERYIYVVDRETDELLAYPVVGADDRRPTRTVKLNSQPFGVATDHEGNVYVSEQHSNNVEKFSSGLKGRIGLLTSGDGIANPTGVTVDSHDNLYVASEGKVLEFAPGSKQAFTQFDAPNGFGITGIAVNRQGVLFALMFDGPGGFVEEFSNGTRFTIAGTASQGGIAVTANGDLAVADATTLVGLAPQLSSRQKWVAVSHQNFGLAEEIGLLTAGQDGTIYVPLDPPVNQVSQARAAVVVIPVNGPQYRITYGLSHPIAAAVGP